jgi:multiple sugar transport system substrate-binding protein
MLFSKFFQVNIKENNMSLASGHILSDVNYLMSQRKLRRRSFLQHALKTCAVGSVFSPILAGCQSQSKNKININWACEGDSHNSFDFFVNIFNSTHSDINVSLLRYDDLYTALSNYFTPAHNQQFLTPDVMSLDIVWMKEFALRGWITPLDSYWPQLDPDWLDKRKSNYLTKPLETVTFQIPPNSQKRIWGAPFHTDVGILYYRTDMPPDIIDIARANQWTWDDIANMCSVAKANQQQAWRFAWQGKLDEGLVCNFIEVLSSHKDASNPLGQILDTSTNPPKVIVNSQAALETLRQMTSWVQPISPKTVLTDNRSDTNTSWTNGDAAFMRNWPSFITESSNPTAAVADKFNITKLPSQSKSCLGGWQLAINSSSQNQDAAWEFIKWLLQEDAQRYLAANEAYPVTLQKIYDDDYINQQIPFYRNLRDIVEKNSQPRPMIAHYPTCVTKAIQNCVHQTLSNPSCYPPEVALQDLEKELQRILTLPPTVTCRPMPNSGAGCGS